MYLCFDPGCVQLQCSCHIFKFLKAGCPDSWALFEQDDVRENLISDVYSQITSAAVVDPVDDTAEENKSQYAPLTNAGCYEETVRQKTSPCLARDVVPVS